MSLHSETLSWLDQRSPHESEYRQAVEESFQHIIPIVNANHDYKQHNVLQRAISPDRVIQFKVEWEDDNGCCRINEGFRVQHSNKLGPYKGGTRFHPSVNVSVLKFLAYEQSFKNALTGLALGAGKGGADFDPQNASASEIRRFSKAYMQALQPYIGATTDVPAGDINVSDIELGYMFGENLKTKKAFNGVLSGKPLALGGSEYRTQATGSGVVYFTQLALENAKSTIEEKSVCISGAGNVALHAALKAIEGNAVVKTLSNSKGFFLNEGGISRDQIHWLFDNTKDFDNPLAALAENSDGEFLEGKTPWEVRCDISMPCATQNEIDRKHAATIVKNGTSFVVEGANMPCNQDAVRTFKEAGLTFVPGKAANAGGVILSAFEMQQNASMHYRSKSKLDEALQGVMKEVHELCLSEADGQNKGPIDYEKGANIAAFRRVADAIVASGY
ncbi:NADP-specific glutamate dehydrogenase [Glaciecola sp. MH2013]|uniref:NADP-specific glutamate dehydrogenase n=1 Tax=Glaciecola sp. MH2013 TaxID=2785524 RepID=UPI00189F4AF5|nr:NADP-specific glutamate dehydrogenase [Glaciecola sp. MH2013]MBF7073437.1 NADP-specific glutamate dehydrogenase [Glaciecola sp. MH2013]